MAAANQMSSSSIQDGEKATQHGRVSVSLASGYDCERYENGRKGSFGGGEKMRRKRRQKRRMKKRKTEEREGERHKLRESRKLHFQS